jgi:hypothetical protein
MNPRKLLLIVAIAALTGLCEVAKADPVRP